MSAADGRGPLKGWLTKRRGVGNANTDMDDKVGTSCWGWTFWALAFFGVAIALVYLLGGFDVAPAVAR